MFMEERHQEITETLRQNGKISIEEITQKYGISDESARRDLRSLEKQGICRRTHGGAILPQSLRNRASADRKFEEMPILNTYREIARAAATMIYENCTVYLTGGSVGYIMLSFLPKDIPYTVIVNSVDLGKELREFKQIEIYLAGGKMRQSGSFVDSLACEFVSRIHFDLCFLTGSGLTAEFGLSNGTDETAVFQHTILNNSRKKCLLMPGVKIGTDSFIIVCSADCFVCIITDWECAEDQLAALREKKIEVITVDEPK